jgi:4-oxalocrotonate tautomerase
MPLVRIDLLRGKSAEYRRAIGDAVHTALVEHFKVPVHDHFQIITEHDADGFIHDAEYLGIAYTDDLVMIQITITDGRPTDTKRALFARIAELLAINPGVRKQDVFVSLVEVTRDCWSFGNGIAQYVS